MPRISTSVRIAGISVVLLSMLHTFFWGHMAFSLRTQLPREFPYNYIFPVMSFFSVVGLMGVFVGLGLFSGRNWARVAILALAAVVAFFCAFAMAVVIGLLFISGSTTELTLHRDDSFRVLLIYLFVFLIAVWWIILFSRQKVAAQFSSHSSSALTSAKRPSCPLPIALLAWLMIASGALSALSWPLIFGQIPAMLFTHVFSAQASQWIWGVNTALFLACGIGLLKLQRWSYASTIALHVFWLVSLFVSQLSPVYERYLGACLKALQAELYVSFVVHIGSSRWSGALLTAIPTALLITGLFYYRPAFLKAVADSQRLCS